ncbi:MAG: 23S rRNA (guanosine(2251)-2'-O)-methyltransferase RlmB [Desulfuromonadaceae bacterium]|nr:23S rRNA (guanosine(2251)-2'-O)-methyltransferase RlmB [Desulfuromonadaceae bacterium]
MADVLYGLNAVAEALRQGRSLAQLVLVRGSLKPRQQDLLAQAQEAGISVERCERDALSRLAGTDKHQGVVARVAPLRLLALEELLQREVAGSRFYLVLDSVMDPHNFGALIRSAAAAGCHGIVFAKDRSCPVTAVVEKASAGTISRMALCQVTNLARSLELLKDQGVWVYGLAGGGAASLYDVDLTGDIALVVGSEGKGLRPAVSQACDRTVGITMPGAVESLNVSVAAGVALFEAVRQRQAKKNALAF